MFGWLRCRHVDARPRKSKPSSIWVIRVLASDSCNPIGVKTPGSSCRSVSACTRRDRHQPPQPTRDSVSRRPQQIHGQDGSAAHRSGSRHGKLHAHTVRSPLAQCAAIRTQPSDWAESAPHSGYVHCLRRDVRRSRHIGVRCASHVNGKALAKRAPRTARITNVESTTSMRQRCR